MPDRTCDSRLAGSLYELLARAEKQRMRRVYLSDGSDQPDHPATQRVYRSRLRPVGRQDDD